MFDITTTLTCPREHTNTYRRELVGHLPPLGAPGPINQCYRTLQWTREWLKLAVRKVPQLILKLQLRYNFPTTILCHLKHIIVFLVLYIYTFFSSILYVILGSLCLSALNEYFWLINIPNNLLIKQLYNI